MPPRSVFSWTAPAPSRARSIEVSVQDEPQEDHTELQNCRRAELRNFRILPILVAVFAASSPSSPMAQTKNPRQLAEAAMMKADREFNQAAAARNIDRFLALVSENAVFDSAEGRGREAVKKAWAPF